MVDDDDFVIICSCDIILFLSVTFNFPNHSSTDNLDNKWPHAINSVSLNSGRTSSEFSML